MEPLLADLAGLAPGLELRREEDPPREPAEPPLLGRPEIRLERPGGLPARLRFAGYPAGFVRLELAEALLALGGNGAEPSAAGEAGAPAGGETPVPEAVVWVSPTCARCARTVRLALAVVLALPRARLTVVTASEFPREARAAGVRAVPTLVAGGRRWSEPPAPAELWAALAG
ncbi:MAG: hypothetical protein IRZ26_00705 [Clostridia bacterium]|nr:hypothetical protein [Clostridia bacterium]